MYMLVCIYIIYIYSHERWRERHRPEMYGFTLSQELFSMVGLIPEVLKLARTDVQRSLRQEAWPGKIREFLQKYLGEVVSGQLVAVYLPLICFMQSFSRNCWPILPDLCWYFEAWFHDVSCKFAQINDGLSIFSIPGWCPRHGKSLVSCVKRSLEIPLDCQPSKAR